VPRLYALHLWTIFGLALSNVLLGLSILALPWTAAWRQGNWRGYRPILWPFGIYVVGTIGAVIFSLDPRLSVHGLSELFSLGTLVLALLLVRGEEAVRAVVNGMIVSGTLFAVWGLAQFLGGFGDLENRIRGPFSHYMTFAGVLALADLLLLAQMVCGTKRRGRFRVLALVLINLAILGSLTRGAWIAVAVASTLLLALRAPKLLLWAPPLALLFVVVAPVPLVSRLLSIANPRDLSTYDRLCMASAGFRMISERPVTGLGLDMVEERYPIYRHPTAPRFVAQHLHNSYVQVAAERGLPVLGALLWLLLAAMARSWRRYRTEGGAHGARADLHLGMLLALVAFAVAALFEYNWGDSEVQRWALFLLAAPFSVGPLVAEQPA
jgi:O-antigen ligase